MPVFKIKNLSLFYGLRAILDDVSLELKKNQKIGLLGRNGEGKSTLLRIISGEIAGDTGECWLRPGIKVASLEQSLPDADEMSVYEMVADGLAETGELLKQYHRLINEGTETALEKLEKVQHDLEARDGWNLQLRVDTVISQLHLDAENQMKNLSGGWRRRVALARALVQEPDILLLDEPTNHLDLPAIEWLEKFLKDFNGTLLFVTHDRSFLQQIADHIFELDRGKLHCWEGGYHDFLRMRDEQLASEETANALFDKKLAEEEKWIRKGIKARRTRNEGRVRALKAMRKQRSDRREQQNKASFSIETAEKSGKIVIEAENITHSYAGVPVIKDFSCKIMRGDRIGIVGVNGIGKSTLLKILLGEIEPDTGIVREGTKIEAAYSDQLRNSLDPESDLIDNVCGGRDSVTINGKTKHAIGYLGDFLFSPERVRMPVKALSGGEQNRAILAHLFSNPANLLILDEPTNDLDMETLELLEEILLEFKGTVLLVSHDREFMDNVVTSVMVFEGQGKIVEYVGGFSDWAARGKKLFDPAGQFVSLEQTKDAPQTKTEKGKTRKSKLSYKDQRELEMLPEQIANLEKRQHEIEEKMNEPGFYNQDHEDVELVLEELRCLQEELEVKFLRWEELDA